MKAVSYYGSCHQILREIIDSTLRLFSSNIAVWLPKAREENITMNSLRVALFAQIVFWWSMKNIPKEPYDNYHIY